MIKKTELTFMEKLYNILIPKVPKTKKTYIIKNSDAILNKNFCEDGIYVYI